MQIADSVTGADSFEVVAGEVSGTDRKGKRRPSRPGNAGPSGAHG